MYFFNIYIKRVPRVLFLGSSCLVLNTRIFVSSVSRVLVSCDLAEYESNEFDDFCREARIKRELTVPYNPQQNEVVERKNRTICEAMPCEE